MKIQHFIMGAVVGIAAGMILGQLPPVKNAVNTAKKKMKKALKSDED